MKFFIQVIILFFSYIMIINAQEVDFFGEFEQGGLVIGKGENIKDVWLNKKKIQIEDGKTFLFGFDRDEKQNNLLRIKFNNGKVFLKKIILPKREYQIQKINKMKQKYVQPPNSDLERIKSERKNAKRKKRNWKN